MTTLDELMEREREHIKNALPIAPLNLRVEMDPYPHLRDDDGCILAKDYYNPEKLAFILDAVQKAVAA